MEEKDSKGGMGGKIRGQTVHTPISPGIAVSGFLKVHWFCLCTDPTDFDTHTV